jgi:hypothetical protein
MRFVAMGDELVLQSKLGNHWEHIYRVVFLPRVDAEYAICNWFTATVIADLTGHRCSLGGNPALGAH